MSNQSFNQREENIFQELDEPFRGRAYKIAMVIKERLASDKSCKVVIQDGYRNYSDQLKHWKKGRVKDAKGRWIIVDKTEIVTRARPGYSAHEYHRAVHIVLLDSTTNRWLKNDDKRWMVIGEEAANFEGSVDVPGVKWGGNFETLRDYAHIEDFNYKRLASKYKWQGMLREERFEGEV